MRTALRTLLLASSLALTALPAPLLATDVFVVDKGHSEVSFQVRHLVTKVRGAFEDYGAKILVDSETPERSSVEFTITAASVDTGNEKRDAHLRSGDFFDVERYPLVRFRSTKVRPAGTGRYEVTGVLSLRGVDRVVTLPVTVTGFVTDPWGNEKAGFETTLVVNRKDFGMVWNAALDNGGAVLGDEVTVTFNLETQRVENPGQG